MTATCSRVPFYLQAQRSRTGYLQASPQHLLGMPTAGLSCAYVYLLLSAGLPEYCQWDTFNATCGKDEVVLMGAARYGRMELGRCVSKDYGHIGKDYGHIGKDYGHIGKDYGHIGKDYGHIGKDYGHIGKDYTHR